MSKTLIKTCSELIALLSQLQWVSQGKKPDGKEKQIYDFRAKKFAYEEAQIQSLLAKVIEQLENAIPRAERGLVLQGDISLPEVK